MPVFDDFDAVSTPFDAVLITDLLKSRETCDTAVSRFGIERVLVPDLLRIRMLQKSEFGKMNYGRPQWYVVQTQANAENKALAHLTRQGFATYLPRYLKRRRHARRVDVVAAPLFPRYLFVEIDMAVQRWRSIYSTVGVSRLVCNGEFPTSVPERVVDLLKKREDASGFIRLRSSAEVQDR